MDFSVTVLGNSAALPTRNRNTTAQVVNHNNSIFLLDCGEGTQNRIREYGIRFSKASHIFISHLHGDHYYGLPGLITSLHLYKREQPLTIYAPPGLKPIIELNLNVSQTRLSYPLQIIEVHESDLAIYEDDFIEIKPITMRHRIPCFGYLFSEKKERVNILTDALRDYKIPFDEIESIKSGKDFSHAQGYTIPHEKLVVKRAARRYAFCSDTLFNLDYCKQIQGVDLLYHESTFLEADAEKATERYHCTAKQAATVALHAGVNKLLLGHFSSRYPSEMLFEQEAKAVFEHSIDSAEGACYEIG
jgi:ribonuclease Z